MVIGYLDISRICQRYKKNYSIPLHPFAGLDTAVTVIIAITIVLSFATFVICGKNIRQVLRYTPKRFKSKTIVVLIIYPVSAANDVA